MIPRSNTKLILSIILAIPIILGTAAFAGAFDQNTSFFPFVSKNARTGNMLRGFVSSCNPMYWQTQLGAWIGGSNGVALTPADLPGGPYTIVYSDTPDGSILGSSIIWPAQFVVSAQPVDADWYMWVIDGNNQRASDIVSVHTESALGLGKCQALYVVFFSPTIPGMTSTAPLPPPTHTPIPP
jgi:hypothetical protein